MDESESDAQGDDVMGGLYDSSLGQVVDIAERYLDLLVAVISIWD